MRYLTFDTETTGLEVEKGHRIIELGLVEVEGFRITGRRQQLFFNPGRPIDEDAQRIHGISIEFLADKPRFADKIDEILTFIGDDTLVAHNAAFDLDFLNAELKNAGYAPFPKDRIIDSMDLARQRFPGGMLNLDALCRRFKIDNRDRELHGALKDAQLLALVYIELLGGAQATLELEEPAEVSASRLADAATQRLSRPLPVPASPEELAAHAAMLSKLKDPLWLAS